MLKLLFIDLDGLFTKWIKYYFKDIDGVECYTGSIETYIPDSDERVAYMSPLNNYGFMNTGIDITYYKMFRYINISVKNKIRDISKYMKMNNYKIPPELSLSNPYLPVGSALLIPIEGTLHYLAGAPTLSYNKIYIDTAKNVYYSFKGVFKVVNNFRNSFGLNKINTLIIPALCTGSSNISPQVSAHNIFNAYFDCTILDSDIPIYVTPMTYIFMTNEYMTYDKLIEINKKTTDYLLKN
jgi:hypothetical protein